MNVQAFEKTLRTRVRGDVMFDEMSRSLYSTDASIYQIEPVAIVAPVDSDDVKVAVATAVEFGVSILPRGGGTSLAGQTVGESLVLDFSKYMNKVLELNVEEKWVRVQPGLVRDELNAMLAEHGLHFAPDPATANRANVGGMIGNNSSGTKSILFGKTVDHVLEANVLLADGTELLLKELSSEEYDSKCNGNGTEAKVYSGVKKVITENRDEIEKRFPKVMRRVQGYNLDEFIHTDRWNLAKLITGSEGTLCTHFEVKLNLEPLPKFTSVCVTHFADTLEAIRAVEHILAFTPSAVEILDNVVINMARENLTTKPLSWFIEGDPAAILICEYYGETSEDVERRAKQTAEDLKNRSMGYAYPVFTDKKSQADVWGVRKNGLGLMLGIKGDAKPLAFIEDSAIPIKHLPEYIDKVLKICEELKVPVAMYAHASVGVIHVRPILDLRHEHDIKNLKEIADRTFALTLEYEGSWSGEHGDGLVRSWWLDQFFGPQVYGALKEVKQLFDPQNLMNPGKIIDSPDIHKSPLRYGTEYKSRHGLEMNYQYREDGSFEAAVEMCTGVGACRKTLGGTMCPSYIATRDEVHSTRGRANALRLAMTGQLGEHGATSEAVHDVMDLCLSCKGCKSECPSNVDMAKLKSEFLQHYYDKHGLKRRDKLIAKAPEMAAKIAGWKAPFVNAIQSTALFRKIFENYSGFDSRRPLPKFATESFQKWFAERPETKNEIQNKVVLFDDTYINFHEPGIGKSAVELLESCGYQVILAKAGCCQRPRISHGLLHEAKTKGKHTLLNLDKFIQQGLKIVVCEPSCASALTDDLPDLMEDQMLAERIKSNVLMIDVFLQEEKTAGRLKGRFVSKEKKLLIHGHCHQKALYGTESMKSILGEVEDLECNEVDSGCCGMAGSFGYEKEHYDLSRKIAEDRLLPAVRERKPGTNVVACGFSCRHQLSDFADVNALHWVETIRFEIEN